MSSTDKIRDIIANKLLTKSKNNKRCLVCSRLLPVSYFVPVSRTQCKQCHAKADRVRYLADREARIAKASEYQTRPENIARRHDLRPLSHRVVSSVSKSVKQAARAAIGEEVRRGRLVAKPCELCGSTENLQAHHEDYYRQLWVCWLCRDCHTKVHLASQEERKLLVASFA